QSDALLQLRMRCLDRNLDRMGALAAALAGPKEHRALPDSPSGEARYALDPTALAAAPSAVIALPAAAECETLADATELALPADPQQRQEARDAEQELDRGWAAFSLGRYPEAKDIATRIRDRVQHLDAPAVRATALVLGAAVAARIGSPADAHVQLQAALDATAAAHATTLQLDVWARMLRSELFAGDPAKVIEYAPFARTSAAAAGRTGAELDGIVAEAERDAGHLAKAKQLLERALASSDPLRPDQRAVLELNLGSVELALGDSPAARLILTKARDRVISTFGDRHPDVALYDDKLAAAHRARGELRAALALHEQSLALRTATFGAADRSVATSLYHRSETELEAGELAKAEHSLHEAIAIRERVFGATSARLGELHAALGNVDVARGTNDAALAHYAKAAQLDPRLVPALLADRAAAGDAEVAVDVPSLTAGEPLSLDRAAALVAHQRALLQARAPGEVGPIGATLHGRYKPRMDPALVVAIAQAWFDGGTRGKEVADLFWSALANLGNEPNRTALDAAFGLAQCEDPRAGQAARTAISLYQAMPQLGRAGMPLVQELAKKP
ncbi:MAG: tetratricopeptide repeat protein, partial [Kofleriaceae bacterium]